jgi:hypothetical protein
VALARGCPLLDHGGAVEIGELTSHDERFDNWLRPRRATSPPGHGTLADPGCYLTEKSRS